MSVSDIWTSSNRVPFAREIDIDVQIWVKKAHSLSAVRSDRIRSIRAALKKQAYETPAMLDKTIERLRNDVGILLRREWRQTSDSKIRE